MFDRFYLQPPIAGQSCNGCGMPGCRQCGLASPDLRAQVEQQAQEDQLRMFLSQRNQMHDLCHLNAGVRTPA